MVFLFGGGAQCTEMMLLTYIIPGKVIGVFFGPRYVDQDSHRCLASVDCSFVVLSSFIREKPVEGVIRRSAKVCLNKWRARILCISQTRPLFWFNTFTRRH